MSKNWKALTRNWDSWKKDLAKAGSLFELGYNDGYQGINKRSTRKEYLQGYQTGKQDTISDTI